MNSQSLESTPPYVSAGVFKQFLDLLSKKRFEQISATDFASSEISESTVPGLLSALRTMDLIDEDGKVKDIDELIRLGTTSARQDALQTIVERTYEDLLIELNLEEATIDEVEDYFRLQRVTPSTASKAARLFIWLAQEAGFETGEKFEPQKRRKTTRTANKNSASTTKPKSPSTPARQQMFDMDQLTADDYEREYLNILLTKVREAEELPDENVLAEINRLIERVREHEQAEEDDSIDNSDL